LVADPGLGGRADQGLWGAQRPLVVLEDGAPLKEPSKLLPRDRLLPQPPFEPRQDGGGQGALALGLDPRGQDILDAGLAGVEEAQQRAGIGGGGVEEGGVRAKRGPVPQQRL
jgi:hypothetical protein